MGRKKELFKNTLIITVGKICTQLITFFLLPLYTGILTTEEYGTVDLILTYVSLFAPLISLQLEYAIFRYLIDVRNDVEKQKKYITNTFFTLIIVIFIALCIFLIVNIFFKVKLAAYLICIIIVTMFSNMFLQIARGMGDNVGYSIGSVIAGVSNVLLNVIFLVIFKLGMKSILLSQIISNILCFLYLFLREKGWKYISTRYLDLNTTKILLGYSLPMIPNSICWWIVNVSDRTIVSTVISLSANGLYSVANKFSSILVTIYNIFHLSWTETVSLHIDDKDASEFLTDTINEILKFFLCISVGLIASMFILFPLLISNEYKEAYNYVPLLILGSFFNIIMGMLSAIYIGKKKSKEMARSSFWAAILNVAINLLLINKIGIYAAAISTIIAFMIISVYRYLDIQKYIKIKISSNIVISSIFLFTIALVIYYKNNIYMNILFLLFIICYTIFINKNVIILLINKILKK